MKRFILLAITCIVVDQLKSETGWLTKCKGYEVDGEVILDSQARPGSAVDYRPYILQEDETMHGHVIGLHQGTIEPRVEESSDTGKSAQ